MFEGVQYKNPPIIERTIGVYHKIPPQEFERRLPSWIEKTNAEFPVPGHLAEWLIDIEERNGVPLIKSLVPKARIIHLFWRKHSDRRHVHGMRLRPDRLVFHLFREEGNPHRFEELFLEMQRWLPLWADHFGVAQLDGVSVEYVNVLDGNITPQFFDSNGGLRIAEALTIFSNFPSPCRKFTAPLDSRVRLVVDEQKPVYFDVRIRGDDRSTNAVRIDFVVRIFPTTKRLTCSEALEELKVGHRIMLEQFACFFTEKAKISFNS